MTTAMKTIKTWQDGCLTLMVRVEEPIVRFTARASESVAEYVPERPGWTILEGAPTITELVDNQLKFRRRVVDEQAAFVHKLMKAMRPALTRLETKPTALPQPTVTSAVKRPTAKRATAKRGAVRRIERAA
jgi:hypothetical protein